MRALVLGSLLAVIAAPSAQAAFPGLNGKIAYYDGNSQSIWTMNPDGGGQALLRAGGQPAWSPDGESLLFTREYDVRRVPASGGPDTPLVSASGCFGVGSCFAWQGPAWSPDGTRIAAGFVNGEEHDNWYLELYTASAANGSGLDLMNDGEDPSWRPDGALIAFSQHTGNGNSGPLHTVQPDGTGEQTVVADLQQSSTPDYSPDGTEIVYTGQASDWSVEIFVTSGSGPPVRLTNNSASDFDPVWSPDGTKIAFVSNRDGNADIYVMNADGSNQTRLTNDPGYQAQPSWQPTWGSGYPRPKGATPMRVSLVPAHAACTAPNRTHGPPLAYDSCNPPAPESAELTVGDAPASMSGFVRYEAILGDVSTPEDEADLGLRVQISDVRDKDTLADYAGEVQGQASTRMTDRTGSGGDPGTAIDVRFPLTTPCAPTPDPAVGSTCSLTTTLDTLIPGAVVERERTILQLGQVQVVDGGPDGDVLTEPNTVFLRQGVFVP